MARKMTTSNAQRTFGILSQSRGVVKINQLILTTTSHEHVDLSEVTKAFHVGRFSIKKDSLFEGICGRTTVTPNKGA